MGTMKIYNLRGYALVVEAPDLVTTGWLYRRRASVEIIKFN